MGTFTQGIGGSVVGATAKQTRTEHACAGKRLSWSLRLDVPTMLLKLNNNMLHLALPSTSSGVRKVNTNFEQIRELSTQY